MRIKKRAALLSLVYILLTPVAFSSVNLLDDINYTFDQTKLNASLDTFHFMRSFVDYYYRLAAINRKNLNVFQKTEQFSGWCAGDAHAENFGILLLENGSTTFTINDMDDSGPCPIVLDLMRILASSRLYNPNIKTQNILNSYMDGLQGKTVSIPATIDSMSMEASAKGIQIASKDLQGKSFKRKSSMSEVDLQSKTLLISMLQNQFQDESLKVLDIVANSKIGGGSGGLLRFEILISNSKNQLIHLELKELVTPSIAPVATSALPDQATRMKNSLEIDQGKNYSHYYNIFNFQEKSFLLRPKFSGNLGVTLSNLNDIEIEEIINYESYILGKIHAKSVNIKEYGQAINSLILESWQEDISAMTELFNKKFSELKK